MRITRFCKLVWRDVNLTPRDIIGILIFTICGSTVMFLVLTAITYPLCYLTKQPVTEQAYRASIGVLILIVGIICGINYVRKTWKESNT